MVSDEVWKKICEIDRLGYQVAFEGGSMDQLIEEMEELLGPEEMAKEMRKRLPDMVYTNIDLAFTVVDIIRDRYYHSDPDYKRRLYGQVKDMVADRDGD
jgi:hypothetical protein